MQQRVVELVKKQTKQEHAKLTPSKGPAMGRCGDGGVCLFWTRACCQCAGDDTMFVLYFELNESGRVCATVGADERA